MDLSLKSHEVTQHSLEYILNEKSVFITLTRKGSCLWIFDINDGTNLTIEELIGICESIYDSKVIDENHVLTIYDVDDNPIYIRYPKQIENTILSSFYISSLMKRKS